MAAPGAIRPSGAGVAFAVITTLFFAWGFITSNNDPLIAALRGLHELTYTEAMLTQFAFFAAYALMSIPAASALGRLGPSRTIIAALTLMVLACLIVPISSAVRSYGLVLVALFLLASGITALQVAANPLAAALGSPERSHLRLTLAQAFNSFGVVLGVQVGSSLMLSDAIFRNGADTIAGEADRAAGFAAVDRAFLIIAVFLVALVILLWAMRPRIDRAGPRPERAASPFSALASPWARRGALAIFLYVGAEVSIGSVLINFLNRSDVLGASLGDAGWYTGWVYWFGALVGRFVGSALLLRVPAARLLAGAAACAAALAAATALSTGPASAYAALAIGFFNSIMFPTIFSLTMERSNAPVAATSGLLCFAIVGGAILPLMFGALADAAGLHAAFLLPAIAYVAVCGFALAAREATTVRPITAAAGPH